MGFISDAYAQAGAPGGTGGLIGSFVPLILIFVVFWFLLIRPQQKKAKEHKQMVEQLKKGDEVVTNGGLLGRVTEVGDDFLQLEVAEGYEINVQRFAVQTLMPKDTIKSLRRAGGGGGSPKLKKQSRRSSASSDSSAAENDRDGEAGG